MIETTFFLDTTREIFESWLVKRWKPVMFDTAAGGQYSLAPARKAGGKVTIDGAYATPPNAEDVSTCYLLGWVIAFEAIPLDPGRIEVRGTCSSSRVETETAYLELLAKIATLWPDSGLADLLAPAVDAAPAVITSEETTAGPWPPGPPKPELETKRRAWQGWLAVKGKQSQEAYCRQLDPPIAARTLRNWRDDLKKEGIIS